MFLPYKVDVPMARIPFANWALIAVTVVISVGVFMKMLHEEFHVPTPEISPQTMLKFKKLQELQQQGKGESAEAKRLLEEIAREEDSMPELDDELSFPGALDPRNFSFSQLITYQFVHGDLLHLIGNMYFLFIFGNAVNAKLGQLQFLASYLFLGVIGGLGWLVLGSGEPMVGASGAIMGIIGIFFIFFPRNEVSVMFGAYGRGGTFELPAFWLILFYMAADLWGLIRADQGIAYVCHLAGLLCGASLALMLAGLEIVKSTQYEQNLLEALGITGNKDEEAKPKRKKKRRRVQRLPRADD